MKQKSSIWSKIANKLPPIVAGVIIFGFWEFCARYYHIPEIVLPAVTRIVSMTAEYFFSAMWPDFLITAGATTLGVMIASVIGVPLAGLVSQSNLATKMISPFAVFLMTMPMIAVAPVLLLLVRSIGFKIRLLLVILQATPVIMVMTMHGFRKMTKSNYEMARLYGMNRLQTIIKLQFPAALPEIYNGMRAGCIFGMMACVGSDGVIKNHGLGYFIQFNIANLVFPVVFGAILICGITCTLLTTLITLLEKHTT